MTDKETDVPKPPLISDEANLEQGLIQTLQAGHEEWRPDLSGPESHSDWQACARAIMRRYEIEPRSLDVPLHYPCPDCLGLGVFVRMEGRVSHQTSCTNCNHGKISF